MTKANRERAYLHFRDLEHNYEAPARLNTGLTKTSVVRGRAHNSAEALLEKNPELKELDVKQDPTEPEGEAPVDPKLPEVPDGPEPKG